MASEFLQAHRPEQRRFKFWGRINTLSFLEEVALTQRIVAEFAADPSLGTVGTDGRM
jgi:hypothetical protein